MIQSVWFDKKQHPLDNGAKELPKEKAVYDKLFCHVRKLEETQRDIHVQNILHAKLYTNREPMAFEWECDFTSHFRPINNNIENVIQSVADTLEARIGTTRPKATIISRGGTFTGFMQARRLDRFLWSEFLHFDIHNKMRRVFLDCQIYGTGFLKMDIDRHDKEIFVERVNPDEIIVDQRECVSNDTPMTMYHRKLVSRLWLIETYGSDSKKLVKIKDAQAKGFQYTSYRAPAEEQIVVVEGWKLPTRKGGSDGRHTICIENCTLLDEGYERDNFPFVWLKWAEPLAGGFYGRPLVGDLVGYQLRQNELNQAQSRGMDLTTVPRIFAEANSFFAVETLDNSIAKIYRYRGEKPEAVTWNAFPAEFYQERDRNQSKAFQFAGISELSSQSKLPSQARMDSSEAFREYSAIEDARFNAKTQALEDAYKSVARHLVDLNKELHTKYKVNRKVVFYQRYLVDEIEWREVDMDRDRYVLEIGASSIVNMTPAARKDTLSEWLDRGIIDIDTYKAHSGNPDLEKLADQMTACEDYIEYQAEQLMKGNRAMPPDPLMNLPRAFHVMLDIYQHLACLKDTPGEVIDLFIAWLENAKELMNPEPTPQEMMAQAQGLPTTMDPAMGMGGPVQDPSLNPMAGMGQQAVMPSGGMPGMPGAPTGPALPDVLYS